MTRQDYNRAADILREQRKVISPESAAAVAWAFVTLFGNNPTFDAERWLRLSGANL